MWKYQYVRKPIPFTEELRHTLYFESQGITDLAVKLYMLAQVEAIARATGDGEVKVEEEVTKDLIEEVAQDRLRYMQRFLNALRKNDPEELKKYQDIAPLDLEFAVSEAIITLRSRQAGASPAAAAPSTSEETRANNQLEKAEGGSGEGQQPQSQTLSKKKLDVTKWVLIKIALKGELDGMTGYESLKKGGFIRPAREYLEPAMGADRELLSA